MKIAPADAFSLPRFVQLGLRINQFTMVRKPHSEAVTRQLAESAVLAEVAAAAPAAGADRLSVPFERTDRNGSAGLDQLERTTADV